MAEQRIPGDVAPPLGQRVRQSPGAYALLVLVAALAVVSVWCLFWPVVALVQRAMAEPARYAQLGLALAVAATAAWLAGRPFMRFLGLRFTRIADPIWRWPSAPLRQSTVLLLALLAFLALAWLAGTLFGLLAPSGGATIPSGYWAPPWSLAAQAWADWLAVRPAPPGMADSQHWRWAAILAARVAPALAVVFAAGDILEAIARARDVVQGLCFEAKAERLTAPAPPRGTGRNIVVLCDGTGNRADKLLNGQPAITNVCKLHQGLLGDERQVTLYLPGVGSGLTSSERGAARARDILALFGPNLAGRVAALAFQLASLLGNALGTGITGNVADGYGWIVRQYQPGDRIYLIGFSRGAYTARCIAGVIRRCGLLRAGNYGFAADVVRLYLSRSDPDSLVPLREALIHPPEETAVEFLGVFDTVASLGVPLWGWWFNLRKLWSNLDFNTDPAPIVRHIHHAMAMDERRSQFFPTPFTRPAPEDRGWTETLEQVWFRGAHADIGGGYAECGLSDISLGWMLDAAETHGLLFSPALRAGLQPDPLVPLHDELTRNPGWRLFGSWPRWHPVPGGPEEHPLPSRPARSPHPHGARAQFWQLLGRRLGWSAPCEAPPKPPAAPGTLPGRLHPLVLARAAAAREAGRLDLSPVPAQGAKPLLFRTEAHREWDRTGIVLAPGETYRLTWTEGLWRDKMCAEIGPAGQDSPLLGDAVRWAFRFRRRMPRQPWMTLCATVAHPRDWPLHEFGLLRALLYIFVRDPWQLRRQVLPIGLDLATPQASICLKHEAAPGLLYLFANDLWQTAGNNSGGLCLSIERMAEPPAGLPCYVISGDGRWHFGDVE